MKVKDLIEQLKECDQEKFVYIYGVDINIFPVITVDELSDRVDLNFNVRGENNEI
jgi:hypothetical protein